MLLLSVFLLVSFQVLPPIPPVFLLAPIAFTYIWHQGHFISVGLVRSIAQFLE